MPLSLSDRFPPIPKCTCYKRDVMLVSDDGYSLVVWIPIKICWNTYKIKILVLRLFMLPEHKFIACFQCGSCSSIFSFLCIVLSTIVCGFVPFLVLWLFSVLLFRLSDYSSLYTFYCGVKRT